MRQQREFALTVNGERRRVEAAPDTPVLWVLRDSLGLTGTKYGCGLGLCGACTVHLDGVPIRSCATTLSSVGNAEVRTVEGLSRDGSHPLQRAWAEEDVPQCGYCQPGQIMSAAALLERSPSPSAPEIDAALRDNVCRCGTYQRIRRAVQRAARIAEESRR